MSRSNEEIAEDYCTLTPLMRIECYTLCVARKMYDLGQEKLGALASMSASSLSKMEVFQVKEGHAPKSKVMKALGLSYCFIADVDNNAIKFYEKHKNELFGTPELAEFVEENLRDEEKEYYDLCKDCHADAMKVAIAFGIAKFFELQMPELEKMSMDPCSYISPKEKQVYLAKYYEQVKGCQEIEYSPKKEQLFNLWELLEDQITDFRDSLKEVKKVYRSLR